MTRPPPHPDADATRLGWLQLVGAWSHACRRLLGGEFPESQLAVVAFYLALDFALMLVRGLQDIPHDAAARADCPVDARELPKLVDRMRLFRDAILHMGHRRDGQDRRLDVAWSTKPPTVTITATVGKTVTSVDSITKEEIVDLLDQLDAWVALHFPRMVAVA